MSSDGALARRIHTAVDAIREADEAMEPLWAELEAAEKEAKEAGLRIDYPRPDDYSSIPQQPRIYREVTVTTKGKD